jgi:hypothetical protein
MRQVKPHFGNFERCRDLLTSFKLHGERINYRDIHSFIGWADRNTLRMDCNF